VRVHDNFAARGRAIAAAPSLTWLANASKRRTRPARPPRAWISTAAAGDAATTLEVMSQRLGLCLADHGIPLDTSAIIPADFNGAELAIVGAHGGLHLPDGRFFQSIRDEDALVAPARALARALADVKVVILLVCSGSRLDAAPGAHTTVWACKAASGPRLLDGHRVALALELERSGLLAAGIPVLLAGWPTGHRC
jgi:hypothetical protein